MGPQGGMVGTGAENPRWPRNAALPLCRRGSGTVGDLLELCGAVFIRRPKLVVVLPSGKLINSSAWQREGSPPTPRSLAPLLTALASPQGRGADRWWKGTGSKGALSLFLVPVSSCLRNFRKRHSLVCFLPALHFPPLRGRPFPRARTVRTHTCTRHFWQRVNVGCITSS